MFHADAERLVARDNQTDHELKVCNFGNEICGLVTIYHLASEAAFHMENNRSWFRADFGFLRNERLFPART
jgi:hypothetical protein